MSSVQQPSRAFPLSHHHVVTKATPNNLLLKLCRTKISSKIQNKNDRGHDHDDINDNISIRTSSEAEDLLLAKVTHVINVLGADPLTAKDSTNRDMSPLHYAAHRGNIPLIDLLITQYAVPVDIEAQNNWTPLYLAVRNGQLPAAKHLIETYGANVKVRNSNQANLVHAAASGGFTETIPYLVIEHGLDPFEADSLGFRPLLCASNNGHLHVVKFLVELLGQSPHDTHGAGGATAAHYAVGYCHYDIVRYLMQTSFPEKSDRELWRRARQAYLEDKRQLMMSKGTSAVSFFSGGSGTTRRINDEREQEKDDCAGPSLADTHRTAETDCIGCWCDAAAVGVAGKNGVVDCVDYLLREKQQNKMEKQLGGAHHPCSRCRCSACRLRKKDTSLCYSSSSANNCLRRSSPSREERITVGNRGGENHHWDFYPTRQPLGGGGSSQRPPIERPVNILTDFNADGIAPIAWGVNVNDHTVDSKKLRRANLSVCGAVFSPSPSASISNANIRTEEYTNSTSSSAAAAQTSAFSAPHPTPFSSSPVCSGDNKTAVAAQPSAVTTPPPPPGALFNALTTAIHRATFGESFLLTAVEHGYADTAIMMIDSYLCEGLFTYWRNIGIPEATIVAVSEQNDRRRRQKQQQQRQKQSFAENNINEGGEGKEEGEVEEEKNELFKLSPIGEALINSTPLSPHGLTTFHVACRASNMEIVERLLRLRRRPTLSLSSLKHKTKGTKNTERHKSEQEEQRQENCGAPLGTNTNTLLHRLPPFFVDINHVVNQEKLDAVRAALGTAPSAQGNGKRGKREAGRESPSVFSLTATRSSPQQAASHYNGVDGWSPLHFVCATIADTNRYAREVLTAVPSTKHRLKNVAKRKKAVLSLLQPNDDRKHGHSVCESNSDDDNKNNIKRRRSEKRDKSDRDDNNKWMEEGTDDEADEVAAGGRPDDNEEQEKLSAEREASNFLAAAESKKGFQVKIAEVSEEDDDYDAILGTHTKKNNNNNNVKKSTSGSGGGGGTAATPVARHGKKSDRIATENSSVAHEDEDDVADINGNDANDNNVCLDDDEDVPIIPRISESMNTCQAFITLLLEHGADPNLPDVANATPLDVFLEYFLLGDARIRESEGFVGGGGGGHHHGLLGNAGQNVLVSATETLARKLRAYHTNASACLETLLAAGATFDHHYQQAAAAAAAAAANENEDVEEEEKRVEVLLCDEMGKAKGIVRAPTTFKQEEEKEEEQQRSLVRVVQRPSFINALTSFAPIPAPAPIQTYENTSTCNLFSSSPVVLADNNNNNNNIDEGCGVNQRMGNASKTEAQAKGFEPSSSVTSASASAEEDDRLLTSADALSPLLLPSVPTSMPPHQYAANHHRNNSTLNNNYCCWQPRGGAQHYKNTTSTSSSSWMLSSVDSIQAIKTKIAEAEAAKEGANNESKSGRGRCCDRGRGGNDKCVTSSSISSPLSPSGEENDCRLRQSERCGGGVDGPHYDHHRHDASLDLPSLRNNDNDMATSFSYSYSSSFIFSPIPLPLPPQPLLPSEGAHHHHALNTTESNTIGDDGGDNTKKKKGLVGSNNNNNNNNNGASSISSLLPAVVLAPDYPLLAPAAHELLEVVRYDPTQPMPAHGGHILGASRFAMNPIPIPSLLTAPVIFTSTTRLALDEGVPNVCIDDNEREAASIYSASSPSSSLGSFITAANLRYPKLVVLEGTTTSSLISSSSGTTNPTESTIGDSTSTKRMARKVDNKKPTTTTIQYVPTLVRQVSSRLRSLSIYREGGAWSFGSTEPSPVLQSLFAFYNEDEIPWEEEAELLHTAGEERTDESVSDAEDVDEDHDDDDDDNE